MSGYGPRYSNPTVAEAGVAKSEITKTGTRTIRIEANLLDKRNYYSVPTNPG